MPVNLGHFKVTCAQKWKCHLMFPLPALEFQSYPYLNINL